MSASPPPSAVPSSKRPLEDPSSPSGPNDQPDAKRPALDKVIKGDDDGHKSAGAVAEDSVGTKVEVIKPELSSEAAPLENGARDVQGDTVVPDAPNGAGLQVPSILDTQPIQSTASQNDRSASHPAPPSAVQDETGWIHVRAVISSAEAATCIGKGGENVSQIRRLSGAKCTVSDYSRGAVERILTVSGLQDAVAKVSRLREVKGSMLTCPRPLV